MAKSLIVVKRYEKEFGMNEIGIIGISRIERHFLRIGQLSKVSFMFEMMLFYIILNLLQNFIPFKIDNLMYLIAAYYIVVEVFIYKRFLDKYNLNSLGDLDGGLV